MYNVIQMIHNGKFWATAYTNLSIVIAIPYNSLATLYCIAVKTGRVQIMYRTNC